jgi:uncharacterized membrane protein
MQKQHIGKISPQTHAADHTLTGASLKSPFYDFVCEHHPHFTPDSLISFEELNRLRHQYLEKILLEERTELTKLEQQVLSTIQNNTILNDQLSLETAEKVTFGQNVADKIALFGGSWTFILSFFIILMAWITTNLVLSSKAFDPFPFILLNLVLSCLAAIQAPIIMMSQNRQEEKDRRRAENDFKVNLKAELELRLLHDKVDHLLVHQNQRLLEIQEIQVQYLQEIASRMKA